MRAASYGHSLGGAVGLGHVVVPPEDSARGVVVNKAYLQEGLWEAEVNGQRYPVRLSIDSFYDPTNSRIKC